MNMFGHDQMPLGEGTLYAAHPMAWGPISCAVRLCWFSLVTVVGAVPLF
jgi:hypothetical protein